MIGHNWEYVKKRVSDKIKGWQELNLTEVGKAVLIKMVIMPIISFTGAIVDLPDLIEKQLAKIVFEFLWGKTEKITRALAHQGRENGVLGVPHIRSQLEAYKATWIAELPYQKKPWTKCFGIEVDWSRDGILNSFVKLPKEDSHAGFKAWNGVVALLAPPRDQMSIEPYLPQEIKMAVRKKAQNILFRQVEEKQFEHISNKVLIIWRREPCTSTY